MSQENKISDRMISNYQFVSIMAYGGMSTIYKGIDIDTNKCVVIKELPEDYYSDIYQSGYLEHEYSMAYDLIHSSIVRYLKLIQGDDNRSYLISKYFNGVNAVSFMNDHAMTHRQITNLIIKIAKGIEFIHNHGIVHCDIKPDNILINSSGVVKIIDFGLAKLINPAFPFLSKRLRGTKKYMAPEQLKNKINTVQTDIYSFGLTCHEMLSDELPYSRWRLAWEKIVPFEHIIIKALEKRPINRYKTMGEIINDLLVLKERLKGEGK